MYFGMNLKVTRSIVVSFLQQNKFYHRVSEYLQKVMSTEDLLGKDVPVEHSGLFATFLSLSDISSVCNVTRWFNTLVDLTIIAIGMEIS